MKNWLIPIAVLGLSGLGLLCATPSAQEKLQDFFERLGREGDPLGEFNTFLDQQLAVIQSTLDHLARALEPRA